MFPAVGRYSIRIPADMCCPPGPNANLLDLVREMYRALETINDPEAYKQCIIERAILAPTNDDVDTINNLIAQHIDFQRAGYEDSRRTYVSVDDTVDEDDSMHWPVELLNAQQFSGLPPHMLHLQVGCPIMLLRNLTGGLANGTRLIVTRLMDTVIQAEVMTGPDAGNLVVIPKLSLTPSDKRLPVMMRRLQFPVRPAFAMTINKAQGQTLRKAGLYLKSPVFSHGQLYVALSKASSRDGITIVAPGGWRPEIRNEDGEVVAPAGMYVDNVVFTEVFRD